MQIQRFQFRSVYLRKAAENKKCVEGLWIWGFEMLRKTLKVTFSHACLEMLFEAWQQSSLTGCATPALIATWPSFAQCSESTAQYWPAYGGETVYKWGMTKPEL